MNGRWERLGHLTLETTAAPWAVSHAALPMVEPDGAGGWWLYLSLRDGEGRARIGRCPLVPGPVPSVGPVEPDPCLDLGTPGTFDDSGVVGSCLVREGDVTWLYYTGWIRRVTVPFQLASGLARREGAGPFVRVSRAPILERTDREPYLNASPFVLHEGDRWIMWYIGGQGWRMTDVPPEPLYDIRVARSRDGVTWQRDGEQPFPPEDGEHAFGRPWVLRDADGLHMWFAVRGDRYRIGYAWSPDGHVWHRDDACAGLGPGTEAWDNEMVEYPCVFDAGDARYMLYNGNGYGRTGVGIAVWREMPAGQGR